MPDPAADSIDAAARRLDEALARLAGRVGAGSARGGAAMNDDDRTGADRLAADLEAERRRARGLEQVAAEASAALGRAAAEVRAALSAEA